MGERHHDAQEVGTMFQTRDFAADDRTEILHAEGLRKVYGARTALKNLSFSLQGGGSWVSSARTVLGRRRRSGS